VGFCPCGLVLWAFVLWAFVRVGFCPDTQFVIDMRELIGPLISVLGLVLFISDVYCFFDPPIHFVAFSVNHLSLILIYMAKSDGVVVAETSIIIQ